MRREGTYTYEDIPTVDIRVFVAIGKSYPNAPQATIKHQLPPCPSRGHCWRSPATRTLEALTGSEKGLTRSLLLRFGKIKFGGRCKEWRNARLWKWSK